MGDKAAFIEATNALADAGVPLARVAEFFDIAPGTLSRWRNPASPKRPRAGWRAGLAQLADAAGLERGTQASRLVAIAQKLSRGDGDSSL